MSLSTSFVLPIKLSILLLLLLISTFLEFIGIGSIPIFVSIIFNPDYLSEKLRLTEFLNKKTGELSSGQKNRVSLAKALINDPKILFLDDPTASLDPETGDFVRTFIEKLSKEREMSILLASHNMDEVKRLCKNVLMMKDGLLIDQGTPNELIKKHGKINLEEVFLKLNRTSNEF